MVDKKALLKIFDCIKFDEPLKRHCTFGIGGVAEIFAEPETIEKLLELIKFLEEKKIKYKVVGNSSNILFGDGTIGGVLISTVKIDEVLRISDCDIVATAGVKLSKLSIDEGRRGLSGLEFAVGIPATIGGSVFMNAGAFGGQMSDVVSAVWFFENGKIKRIVNENCEFGYRTSIFVKKPNAVILFVELKLTMKKPSEVLIKMNNFIQRRLKTQPSGKSAGSIFKSTPIGSAGMLIDRCDLKGKTIGGATVSDKHANFILNTNNASFLDVYNLITLIKKIVKNKFNEELELEIEIIKE